MAPRMSSSRDYVSRRFSFTSSNSIITTPTTPTTATEKAPPPLTTTTTIKTKSVSTSFSRRKHNRKNVSEQQQQQQQDDLGVGIQPNHHEDDNNNNNDSCVVIISAKSILKGTLIPLSKKNTITTTPTTETEPVDCFCYHDENQVQRERISRQGSVVSTSGSSSSGSSTSSESTAFLSSASDVTSYEQKNVHTMVVPNSKNESTTIATTTTTTSGRVPPVLPPVQFTAPDLYGQIHPIETNELITCAIQLFDYEIQQLSSEVRKYIDMAYERCPNIVDNQNVKLIFLRCEVYNCYKAVQRYVLYWDRRVELFGMERAYMNLSNIKNYTTNEIQLALGSKMIQFIPITTSSQEQDQQEPINSTTTASRKYYYYINYGNFVSETMSNENFIRGIWFLAHKFIENDRVTQKLGVIAIINSQTIQRKQLPSHSYIKKHLYFCQGIFPMRISGVHVMNPPTLAKVLFPMVKVFITNPKVRNRILIHTELCMKKTIKKVHLIYNVQQHDLPMDIGGTNTTISSFRTTFPNSIYDWIQTVPTSTEIF